MITLHPTSSSPLSHRIIIIKLQSPEPIVDPPLLYLIVCILLRRVSRQSCLCKGNPFKIGHLPFNLLGIIQLDVLIALNDGELSARRILGLGLPLPFSLCQLRIERPARPQGSFNPVWYLVQQQEA
jgi:hypothetical protein